MKLNEMYSKSLKELIENELELVDMDVYTEDNGTVANIELRYRPKEEEL